MRFKSLEDLKRHPVKDARGMPVLSSIILFAVEARRIKERCRWLSHIQDMLAVVHGSISTAKCLYCDWRIDVAPDFTPVSPDAAGAALRRHVETECSKHPMRRLETIVSSCEQCAAEAKKEHSDAR